jgi:nucleotide-binding universal stress UspA family protein
MKARVILHPTDFSSASRRAFTRAVNDARAQRAQLLLLHVLSPVVMPIAAGEMMSPHISAQVQQSTETYGRKQLDKLVGRAKAAGVRARGLLLQGDAADAIVRTARSQHAAEVVMGTHGRSGIARLLMGSVAQRVVGTSPCPVLTVRGR